MKLLLLSIAKIGGISACCLFASSPVVAQISADGTTATNVTTPDGKSFAIEGGDFVEDNSASGVGGNLFHSFRNFSVPDGGSANFLNSPDIVNIINRVTGGEVSEIYGAIKASGRANLFLINPAGIVFGPNASLNIGGSFLGSTADSLRFADGKEFSATQPTKPLLTINAPIGLNLRDNPGNIVSQSGFVLEPEKNFALVGGDVSLLGGRITAPGGRIELGGLTVAGEIGIASDGSLTFPDRIARGNVSLSDRSSINVFGTKGGSIGINAENISLLGNSFLRGGNPATTGLIGGRSGDISLNATRAIDIDASQINNLVGVGSAGDIKIATGSLFLKNSAQLNAGVNKDGNGNAGDIIIKAKETVSLDTNSRIVNCVSNA